MKRNLAIGLAYGFGVATIYSCYVIILYFVRGDAPFQSLGVTVPTVLASYYVGALVGGIVVGLLLPLGQNPIGAACIGFIAAIPVLTAFGMMAYSPSEWGSKLPETVFHIGIFLGPLCGLLFWFRREQFRI